MWENTVETIRPHLAIWRLRIACRITKATDTHSEYVIQWKPLIMITLELALFDNNNRLITLSGGYKNLHYLTKFIVTVQHFTCIKKSKRMPSIFKGESTGSCICLWKLAVAVATYVSICTVYRILPSFAF
jgi:hypothetical protein